MKYQFYPKCFPLHSFMKDYVMKYSDDEFIDKYEGCTYISTDIIRKLKTMFGNIKNLFGTDNLDKDCDAFYSAGCYYGGDKPYVLDIYDNIYSITGYNYNLFMSNLDKIRESLIKENCCKIICRSETTWDEVYKYFNSPQIMDKVILEKPFLDKIDYNKPKKSKLVLTFISSINNEGDFYQKGGHYAIEVYKQLSKDYDVVLNLKAEVPLDYIYEQENNIKEIDERLTKLQLHKLYTETDIMLCLNQTYVLMNTLEAKAYSIPIIALDTYQVKDYIRGNEGRIIRPPKHLAKFYKDKSYPTNIRDEEFVEELKKIDKDVVNSACNKIIGLIK